MDRINCLSGLLKLLQMRGQQVYVFASTWHPWFHGCPLVSKVLAYTLSKNWTFGDASFTKGVIYAPDSVSGDPLNPSVRESIIYVRRIHPHKGKKIIDHSAASHHCISFSMQKVGEKNMYFQHKMSRAITPHADNQSIPLQCFQLEDMLDKMNKINRACESGCQNSFTDGHFTNRSEHEYV